MIVTTEHEFDAAHSLPEHPGACSRLHGHRYRFQVHVAGPVDPVSGLVMDFEDLERLVQAKVLDVLDHQHLNRFIPVPTAEHLAVWIWDRLAADLPGLAEVRVWETPRYSAIYRGPEVP